MKLMEKNVDTKLNEISLVEDIVEEDTIEAPKKTFKKIGVIFGSSIFIIIFLVLAYTTVRDNRINEYLSKANYYLENANTVQYQFINDVVDENIMERFKNGRSITISGNNWSTNGIDFTYSAQLIAIEFRGKLLYNESSPSHNSPPTKELNDIHEALKNVYTIYLNKIDPLVVIDSYGIYIDDYISDAINAHKEFLAAINRLSKELEAYE